MTAKKQATPAGRPGITLSLPATDVRLIEALARKERRSRSAMVSILAAEALAARGIELASTP